MPSFRTIDAKRRTSGSELRLFVLARQEPAVVHEYLLRHHLKVDRVIYVSHDAIRRAGFPTTIAVNAQGIVTGVWRGRVSPRVETSIFTHLFPQ
jgi:hypothetical protein